MKVNIKSTEVLFEGFFTVERARLSWQRFDGSMTDELDRFVIRRGDSVGIVPYTRRGGRIILVKQFRYPATRKGHNGYLWEIPAGMIDGDERPEEAARRELSEEIGLMPEKVEYLTSFFLSPGAIDERMHLFSASVSADPLKKRIGGNAREHENLLIRPFRKGELKRMIREAVIVDSKTITGILYYYCLADL
jgi:nudix-type nucleoside diphosphatase (YffH/AdpP family)